MSNQAITEREFEQLARYIELHCGIHLKEEEKISLIIGRLSGVLAAKGMDSFSEYYEYLVSEPSGEALEELVNKITTNHTFFMREEEHFRFLKQICLPYFVSVAKDRDLRIWSAGCSSGEEPYTLAMILDDYFGSSKYLWDTRILATDISATILAEARSGIYRKEEVDTLPPIWRQKYFMQCDQERCVVTDQIQKEVIFRRFNLMDQTFPFRKKFHVIFCRNVMIYFDNDTKNALVERFYDSLERGDIYSLVIRSRLQEIRQDFNM